MFERCQPVFVIMRAVVGLTAVGRGEWNQADHLFQYLWTVMKPIEAFDLLMSVAIPKNCNDDHYFIFPSFVWRCFENGILDRALLPLSASSRIRP